ncbi:MAG: amidase [Acidobacteria bacterium]|nr:amidase [Acidobacteriota bacterium]
MTIPAEPDCQARQLHRRRFLAYFSAAGLSSTLLPGILWAMLQETKAQRITVAILREAEQLAGLEFTDKERESMVAGLNQNLERYEQLRKIPLHNGDWPAQQFSPVLPGMTFERARRPFKQSRTAAPALPSDLEEAAFWPVTWLAQIIKARKVSSEELTRMYLARLRKYDAKLQCVITLTEDLALQQARQADVEIRAGRYRGPLHGIPWGVKDLLAVKGYPTTWGAAPYKDQVFDYDATVVERLDRAGAVLLAKLSTGELASGDIWFGGQTKTPWNLKEGTRGSSAGPGAATAAGLAAFSIGTETRGSITFPSSRCGLTGLRPTFGRVSRYGVMAISYSMDKIGPMCRNAEDCALVFNAIYGPDGRDLAVMDLPFNWDSDLDIRRLRVGYIRQAFEEDHETAEGKANDLATLEKLRSLGITLVPVDYPDYPVDVQQILLYAEAAAAFDELTRNRGVDQLARQAVWPVRFRQARTIPAVEYIQADRVRRQVMAAMARMMADLDICVAPSSAPGMPSSTAIGRNVPLTNLTGYPGVVLPNGFSANGIPTSITFIGRLYEETKILALAKRYQDATDFHLKRPSLE